MTSPRKQDQKSVDETISATVAALIAGSGLKKEQVATALGLATSSLYLKLAGDRPWRAWEVAALAEHFNVSIGDIYDGLGGLFGGRGRDVEDPRPAGADRGSARWPGPGSNRRPFTFQANARTD